MKSHTKESRGLGISGKSFLTAVGILAVLMAGTYLLTLFVPAGSFERAMQDGKETILAGTYHRIEGGIPFWKWLLSPLLVLGSSQGGTLIAVILFLLILGGTSNILNRTGTMRYMLGKVVHATGDRKYLLLVMVSLLFFSLGAFVGSTEEIVPMVPFAVALSLAFGWDEMVGLGMSLGAVACGFSTGVLNPFTTGVAQTFMGLPMFSGVSLRLLTYVVIYLALLGFLISRAGKCEKRAACGRDSVHSEENSRKGKSGIPILPPYASYMSAHPSGASQAFERDSRLEASVRFFAGTMLVCFGCIVLSAFLPGLSDFLLVLVALFFLVIGVGCGICSGEGRRRVGSYFFFGIISLLPSVLLILMAGSVQYTMTEAGILDTLLYWIVEAVEGLPVYGAVLCIFLFCMAINFFVSSGSAQAVLMMPLLAPLADLCGISRQLTVLAFLFGDGFSNLIYFTNPVLLIALSLAGVSYGRWIRWSARLHVMIFALCCLILMLGAAIGY